MKKQAQKRIEELNAIQQIESIESNFNRARSITVGTAFGGTTEVMMRGSGGDIIWCILQPVEVIELIHQLAANVGCHIAIKPRSDFASWRNWKYTEEELAHYRGIQDSPGVGFAPHVNDMAPHAHVGTGKESFLQPEIKAPEKVRSNNNEAVATKKPSNGRGAKRASKAA